MPIDINFGALQQANPFAAYAQGQELGQQNRLKQARQAAGNVFSTDPDKAANILLNAGDYEGGLTLRKTAKEDRVDKTRAAAVAKYGAGDAAGAQADLVGAGDYDTAKALSEMTKEQRATARQNNEDLGGYAQTLLGAMQGGQLTPQDAKEHILQDKPHLLELGLTEQQIDGFDPTPQNLQMLVSKGMDLKLALEQADKTRTFGETQRHNKASEANSAGQLAISRGQLGVAQGSLGVRQQEFKARKAAGGFGTPGIGAAGAQPKGAWEEF